MTTAPLNLFISYRRPCAARATSLAVRLGAAMQPQWQALGQVFVDKTAVINPKRFATCLVDNGLNRSVAVLAVVDDAWLDPANLQRLNQRGDWVSFELSYAIEHSLCIVLVGSRESQRRLATTPLRDSLAKLHRAIWFEWDEGRSVHPQAQALIELLSARLPDHRRRASSLRADARHNDPKFIDVEEAKANYNGPRSAYLLLAGLDLLGRGIFFAGGLLALLGAVTMLDRFTQGLVQIAGGATLMAVWWLANFIWRSHLARHQSPRNPASP